MGNDLPTTDLTFRGEEYLSALLLAIVLRHCGTATRGELDSRGIKANDDAMISCAEDGFIDLTGQEGGRLFGAVRPEGWALLERLRADQAKEAAGRQAWIDRLIHYFRHAEKD
jgi:hypothetical protein